MFRSSGFIYYLTIIKYFFVAFDSKQEVYSSKESVSSIPSTTNSRIGLKDETT